MLKFQKFVTLGLATSWVLIAACTVPELRHPSAVETSTTLSGYKCDCVDAIDSRHTYSSALIKTYTSDQVAARANEACQLQNGKTGILATNCSDYGSTNFDEVSGLSTLRPPKPAGY